MNNGFIKVAAATVEITVADTENNTEKIIKCIEKADSCGVNLLILPELCVTGYTCGDLFLSNKLINASTDALIKIAKATAGKYTITAIGLPVVNNGKIYNCAAILQNGKILGIVPKTHIPNYGEFCESRYFASGNDTSDEYITLNGENIPFGNDLIFRHRSFPDYTFGIEICEDLWTAEPVSTSLCLSGAAIIGNLSATDEVIGKASYRRTLINSTSARLLCGYIYASADFSESTQDMVFSRHSLISENGTQLAENPPFGKDNMIISEIDVQKLIYERRRTNTFVPYTDGCRTVEFFQDIKDTALTRYFEPNPFVPSAKLDMSERAEEILTIQSYGLKKRIEHTHAKTAVIGISGGLDSTLAILATVRAMRLLNRPMTDIIAVTMPCFGTTSRTKSNAVTLCELLGVTLKTVNITASVKQHFADIGQSEDNYDVTYENSQARERTQVLMDIANMENGMVIGTGDLSELALGWATYNGDHMSMYGVNASIPKTLVRHVVRYEALHSPKELSDVLLDILDTPVSPELLPATDSGDIAQKTEDLVGPYELHDFFLFHMIRYGETPSKIYRLALKVFEGQYKKEVILKWLKVFTRRFFNQQFKRSCLPDGPKVGSVTLSPRGDWHMPSDASARIWLDEIENLQ